MRLAVITSSNAKALPGGETLALSGFNYDLLVWDEAGIDGLSRYDCILVRTCWDYHLKYPAFRSWLDQLANSGLNVVNPVQSLVWNSTKNYLLDLMEIGIPVVPTYKSNQLAMMMADFPDQDDFIVKPLVSATAFNLEKVRRADIENSALEPDVIVQPFIKEIHENGEWSLIYFDNFFSHAVLKKPKPQEFRVQSDFGGTVEFTNPPDIVSKLADLVVARLPVRPHYCRVDVVKTKAGALLMEIEMVEPELFIEGPLAISNYKRFVGGLSKK
ncbi:MAG TPA: hypothetical protein VFE50_25150 [Cyclobacteriaceae bacterium]|nr:hypothetical protein [Cyclobacteriaceae bacterium]